MPERPQTDQALTEATAGTRPGGRALRQAAVIALWFALALLVFYRGHLYSNDDAAKLESAESLLTYGDFEVRSGRGAWGIVGSEGKRFSHFPLGSILAYVPAVVVWKAAGAITGHAAPEFVATATAALSTLLCTAAAGSLMYLLLSALGIGARKALLCAAALLFCTQMLPYSSSGWTEPCALMWGLLAVSTVAVPHRAGWKAWVLFGLLAGIASLHRIEYPVFFVTFAILTLVRSPKAGVWIGAGLVLMSAIYLLNLWFNHYRFGSVFYFGYTGAEAPSSGAADPAPASGLWMEIRERMFSRDFGRRIAAMILVPGKMHFFWAAPLLALLPLAAIQWRNVPGVARRLFVAALAGTFAVTVFGQNSWAWSNRYLYIQIPFLLLPLAFVNYRTLPLRMAAIAAAAVGALVSLAGTLVNYHVMLEKRVDAYGYARVMLDDALSAGGAQFWTHLAALPAQLQTTAAHLFSAHGTSTWKYLRENALDMWPVGLSAVGVPPIAAMALWLLLVAAVVGAFRTIVWPMVRAAGDAPPDPACECVGVANEGSR